jgi:hypothetical protein
MRSTLFLKGIKSALSLCARRVFNSVGWFTVVINLTLTFKMLYEITKQFHYS